MKDGLVDRAEQRAADGGIVEGRLQMVDAQHGHHARRVQHLDLDIRRAAQQRQHVVIGVFHPVLLARLQGGGRGADIRHGVPDDPVVVDDLRPRRPIRPATLARLVAGEFLINVAGTRHAFIRLEAERAAADDLPHLLERVRLGQPLRHHGAHGRRDLAQRLGQ
jgi:hypothetical protein